MLINSPKTDINLKSDGGITPLMDAVKTTMVKKLVKMQISPLLITKVCIYKLHCDSSLLLDICPKVYIHIHVCGYA